ATLRATTPWPEGPEGAMIEPRMVTGLLVMLGVFLASCGIQAAPSLNPPPPSGAQSAPAPMAATAPSTVPPRPATVKNSILPSLSSAATFVARERGYFQEEGIEVESTPLDGSTESTSALAAGQLDVATGGTAAGLYNSIARGIDVRIVLDVVTAYPWNDAAGIIVRK